MRCAIGGETMRVERLCSICDRAVCSKCSRPMGTGQTACHGCIPQDRSGRSSRDSWRAGASQQGKLFRQLMRDKERARADAANAAWREAGYPTPGLDPEKGGNG